MMSFVQKQNHLFLSQLGAENLNLKDFTFVSTMLSSFILQSQ